MTSSTVEALKPLPCPFCASVNVDPEGWASTDNEGGNYRTGPACDDCGASADSVERWNARPHQIEAQGSEPDEDEVERVAKAIATKGFGRPWSDFLPVNADDTDLGDLREYASAALSALTRPDHSLGSREDVSALADKVVLRVCEYDDRTSPEDWPEALLITSEELHAELMQFADALSPPSLGMEGVRELQALSDAAMVGPWHSEPGAWISGPDHKGLIADCHPTFGGATDEHKATSKFIVAAVNYVRQALASISTPSGEVG